MVDLLVEYGNMMLSPFAYAAYGLFSAGVILEIDAGISIWSTVALSLLNCLDAKPIQARSLFPVSDQIQRLNGEHT